MSNELKEGFVCLSEVVSGLKMTLTLTSIHRLVQ